MRDILTKYNISENKLDYGDKNKEIKIDEKNIKLIKTTFERKHLENIDNLHEFNKMHMKMIRSIAPIIILTKKIKGKETYYHYEYNTELIEKHKELAQFRKNQKCKN